MQGSDYELCLWSSLALPNEGSCDAQSQHTYCFDAPYFFVFIVFWYFYPLYINTPFFLLPTQDCQICVFNTCYNSYHNFKVKTFLKTNMAMLIVRLSQLGYHEMFNIYGFRGYFFNWAELWPQKGLWEHKGVCVCVFDLLLLCFASYSEVNGCFWTKLLPFYHDADLTQTKSNQTKWPWNETFTTLQQGKLCAFRNWWSQSCPRMMESWIITFFSQHFVELPHQSGWTYRIPFRKFYMEKPVTLNIRQSNVSPNSL